MKTLKINHLITSLEGGGTENFLLQILSRSPASFRHKVYYLKRSGVISQRIRELGISVEKASGFWGVLKSLRQDQPQILHTCLFRAHQIGRWAGAQAKVPLIISSQRSIDGWTQPWHRWVDQWTLKKCHAVLVNSNAAQQVIEKRKSKNSLLRIVKIPNGLDLDRFVKQDRWKARQTYDIPMDAQVGGTLMRLHREKGADRIPEFAAQLLSSRTNLHLLVGGVGPLESALKKSIRGKPWASRLHFLGWEQDTVRFLSAIDFFWSLSREESFPQSLLEASGLGIPWIAPQVGGTSELLETGTAGLIYSTTHPLGAVHSSFELLRLLNEMKQKSERAAPTVRAQFALSKMITSFYDVLTKMVPA
jgi:glycosyltransferase involved in cell wall biosynthesis